MNWYRILNMPFFYKDGSSYSLKFDELHTDDLDLLSDIQHKFPFVTVTDGVTPILKVLPPEVLPFTDPVYRVLSPGASSVKERYDIYHQSGPGGPLYHIYVDSDRFHPSVPYRIVEERNPGDFLRYCPDRDHFDAILTVGDVLDLGYVSSLSFHSLRLVFTGRFKISGISYMSALVGKDIRYSFPNPDPRVFGKSYPLYLNNILMVHALCQMPTRDLVCLQPSLGEDLLATVADYLLI